MEKDAMVSHGAAEVLHERMCLSADAHRMVFCRTCGRTAITDHIDKKYMCRKCGEEGDFGTCTVPRSYHLLSHYLIGAGIELKFDFKKEGEKRVAVEEL